MAMTFKIILITAITATLAFAENAHSYSKKEAKRALKEQFSYYDSSRKATKARNEAEANILNRCLVGYNVDAELTLEFVFSHSTNVLETLKSGDKIISINGEMLTITDHPRSPFEYTDRTPLTGTDNQTLLIERNGEELEVKLPCIGNRDDLVEMLEDFALALRKYDGRNFLEKYDATSQNCSRLNLLERAANIERQVRRLNQDQYNSYVFSSLSCALKATKIAVNSDFWASSPEAQNEAFQRAKSSALTVLGFFDKNGGRRYADRLDSELLELEEAVKANAQDINTAEEQTVQIEQKPTGSQQTPKNRKPSADIKTLLATCAEKETADEKLMCFELASQLTESANISEPESKDSEPTFQANYKKNYYLAPNGYGDIVKVTLFASNDFQRMVPESKLPLVIMGATEWCSRQAKNKLSFVPRDLHLLRHRGLAAATLKWLGKNSYGAESEQTCVVKFTENYKIDYEATIQ